MAAKRTKPAIVSVVRLSDGKTFKPTELLGLELDAGRRGTGAYTNFVGLIAGEDADAVRRAVGGYGASLDDLQKRDARERSAAQKVG